MFVALTLSAGGQGSSAYSAAGANAFQRVVVVVFENKSADKLFASPDAPMFNHYAERGAVLSTYFGVSHPSLPNYLALVSGSTHGITTDCTDCSVAARNLADTLGRAGMSWKAYEEGLPTPGFEGAFAGRYAKKHDPFLYFRDVLERPERLKRVVPFSRWAHDLAARSLPRFALVVPDLCHDMHDCSIAAGDRWLRGFLPPLLKSSQLRGGVVFIVFDESDDYTSPDGGQVPAIVVGPLVRPGSHSDRRFDHYSLLRTVEDGLGLPRLGKSASAHAISGIWRPLTARRLKARQPRS